MKIALRNVTKRYRDADRDLTVIRSVTFDFPGTGSVAIVGKSGVGKSTLLHLLGGLDSPSSGEIEVGDRMVTSLSQDELSVFRGEHVGFVFQFHHLLPEFSAVENVMMPFIIRGFPEQDAREVSEKMLKSMGLEERTHHFPGQLSGGEQQRVAIARAAVTRPSLLLADEPTGNLDPLTSAEVQRILLDLNREQRNLLIVVTHNIDLARSMDLTLEMQPGGELRPL